MVHRNDLRRLEVIAQSLDSIVKRQKAGLAPLSIERTLKLRRLREELFPPGLFADPAWDILLDLYLAEMTGRRVSISSAAIASAVPPTTALRWIKLLVDLGLIIRVPDPHDRRRIDLVLTDAAKSSLSAWEAAARE